jgi:protein-disulfide isomerase
LGFIILTLTFMAKKKNGNYLAVAIVVAALVVSAGLFYLGNTLAYSPDSLKADIAQGIEDFVEEQQRAQEEAAAAAAAEQAARQAQVLEGDFTDDDAVKGDADAPVTIVEFSDYECPFCGRYSTQTYAQIKENYIDTGKVKYIFRDLPLSFHAGAYPAALAAECVRDQLGDDGYFEMHDAIFADQGVLKGDAVAGLAGLAEGIVADMVAYNECVESDKFKDEIEADAADAASVGITGTPGFIINGKLVSGAQPYEVFEAIIEEGLSE